MTVVYNRLGRGGSRVDGRIDLDRELDAVAALIDAAGGRAGVLCGHSSGWSIALAATVRGLPVDGLVLWEAPLGPPNSGGREWPPRSGGASTTAGCAWRVASVRARHAPARLVLRLRR